jgi:hypothetical protein
MTASRATAGTDAAAPERRTGELGAVHATCRNDPQSPPADFRDLPAKKRRERMRVMYRNVNVEER